MERIATHNDYVFNKRLALILHVVISDLQIQPEPLCFKMYIDQLNLLGKLVSMLSTTFAYQLSDHSGFNSQLCRELKNYTIFFSAKVFSLDLSFPSF